MQFLYPNVQQFPFDAVCAKIVHELEKRNWSVPGIEIEFDVYGSGEQKFRLVRHIRSHDFKLYFCRVQRTMPYDLWNDTAGVTELTIPKKELRVHDDESGPTFYLYVGKNYERDREKFMNGCKVNSRRNGEPKMYLQYKGQCHCDSIVSSLGLNMPHRHTRRRPPLLVHDNDIGRQYDPTGNEPTRFVTAEVMGEFMLYLEEVVLKMITSHPAPAERVDVFAPPVPIPFPESIGSLFCFGEHQQVRRINKGKKNPEELPPPERYALEGGYRLAALNIKNDGTVPKIAYEGFLWCGIGEITPATSIESLEVPGHYRWGDREQFVLRVKPNRANDIYVADHAAFVKRRKEILVIAKQEKRDEFTDAEVADFMRARARTIVPLNEYRGGYEQPVVLINRELSFDEVEVVSGPHEEQLDSRCA